MFFIRTASIRDIDNIRSLLIATWHDTYDSIYGPQFVDKICRSFHSADRIKQNIKTRNSEYIISDNGEIIAGMAFTKGPEKDGIAYLAQLYVLPDYQSRGIGRDLLKEVEISFPQARIMRLGLDSQNMNAMRFYQYFGYKNTNIRFKENGLEALIFEKKL